MFIENANKLKDVKNYVCGSPNLCKFLESHGLKSYYSYKLGEKRGRKTMWVFVMTPELSELLTEWSNNKPQNTVKDKK